MQEHLTTAQAARFLEQALGRTVTAHRLTIWRQRRCGPPCYRTDDGTYRYDPAQLMAWAAKHQQRLQQRFPRQQCHWLMPLHELQRTHALRADVLAALADRLPHEQMPSAIPICQQTFDKVWELYSVPSLPLEQQSVLWNGERLIPRTAIPEVIEHVLGALGTQEHQLPSPFEAFCSHTEEETNEQEAT